MKRDTTEHPATEDILRISEERFRTLFRDNPLMIVTLDDQLTMLSVNPVCSSQLGYGEGELEGRSVLILFHEDDRPVVTEQLRQCLQNPDQVFHWQFCKVRKDGQRLWVEETARVIHDVDGSLNLLVVCQDITRRRELEEELKQAGMQNELILASAGEGIVGLDLNGNQTFVNASAAAMLGYEVKELVGTHSHSTWHYALPDGSSYPAEKCPIYAAYRDGAVRSGEEVFQRKDGSGLPVHYTSRPIHADGTIVGAVLTFNDITERKRIEEALQESEERFRATFDQAAVGIGLIGPDGRIIRINRKYCEIVGYAEEELKAMSIQDITHPDDLESSRRQYNLMLAGKLGSYVLEKRYIRKNGSTVWVHLTVSTVVDSGGNLKFCVGVVVDITARKEAEEEIERLNRKVAARASDLEVANKDLESFSYTVANDLLRSLLTIGEYAKSIQDLYCSKDDQCITYTRRIYEKTKNLAQLIGIMQDFFRPTRGELSWDHVDLSAMAGQAVEKLRQSKPERRVRFVVAEGIAVSGDASLLRVVLGNLFDNAWQHTVGCEEAVIEFGVTESDGRPAYFVRDNGEGFDMAHAERLFKPFGELHDTEQLARRGVGLAMVEKIVRRHGGRVWAEGKPGMGAVFFFTLSRERE